MDRSAVVLARGLSNILDENSVILELNGKPLIKHLVNAVDEIVNEVIMVTRSEEQSRILGELLGPNVKFIVVADEEKGPLVGALAGFRVAQGKHTLLLASEFPLVSHDVVDLFFELCEGKTAVIPRWPNQVVETLQAVYHTKTAIKAGEMAIEEELFDIEDMIDHMGGVRYISTLAVQEFDPELKTFFKVNTPVDLKMAEAIAKPRRVKKSKMR